MTRSFASIASRGPRLAVVGLLALSSVAHVGDLGAQTAPPERSSGHCFGSSRIVRGIGGAVIGAGLGFFTAKVRLSDWNDASRTSAANRQRTATTIGGAAIGALIGVLVPNHESCNATGRPTGVAHDVRPSQAPITAEEIVRAGVSGSVYDVVYALRRNWLNDRGVNDMNEAPRYVVNADGQEVLEGGEPLLIVYLDNMKMGTIGQLKQLPTTGVVAINYFDPAQANLKWGPGHTHGAIQVVTVTEDTSKP